MQQTPNYNLNKPEMDDTFSTAPLNENMDTVDGTMADLDQRVVTLENCRVVLGTFHGTGSSKEHLIDLGERPAAVLLCMLGYHTSSRTLLLMGNFRPTHSSGNAVGWLTDTGFVATYVMNDTNWNYTYLAFLGGWSVQGLPETGA